MKGGDSLCLSPPFLRLVYSRHKGPTMKSSFSRRTFLIRAAAVYAGTQVAGVTHLFGADDRSKPGVQLYMVAAEFKKDPAGTLAQLKAIGYGYVEAFAMAITNMGEFEKMVGDAGLGCPSGHFAFGFMPTEKVLDDAEALGVRYVVSSVLPPQQPNIDDLKKGNFGGIMQMMNHLTADDFKRMASDGKRDRREREETWSGACVPQPQRGVSQVAGWENRVRDSAEGD